MVQYGRYNTNPFISPVSCDLIWMAEERTKENKFKIVMRMEERIFKGRDFGIFLEDEKWMGEDSCFQY